VPIIVEDFNRNIIDLYLSKMPSSLSYVLLSISMFCQAEYIVTRMQEKEMYHKIVIMDLKYQ
jgi:hypothetical protein